MLNAVIIRINAAVFITFLVLKVERLLEGTGNCKFCKNNCELMAYLILNSTNFNTEPKKLRIKSRRISIWTA